MPVKPSEHWYADCADAMIREGVPMFQYTSMKELGLTQRECENTAKTRAFQETFRVRRNLWYKELAQDPTMSKTAVEGLALLAITKLMEKGAEDKALNGIMQYAKLKGWTTDQANLNIIQDFSSKDLTELRKKFAPTIQVTKEN